jgi:hypothetical protein
MKPMTRHALSLLAGACAVMAAAASAIAAPPADANFQGLWWRASGTESGWGLNITHQADTLFMTWFTYDLDGSGMWLVMSDGVKTGLGSYIGTLYRTTGPAFYSTWWDRDVVTRNPVGTASFSFSDADNGTFTYTVNGLTQSKPIGRTVFGGSVPTCTSGGAPGATPSYQDLWWAPGGSESGWGVNVAHQGDTLFTTWFTYKANGAGQWLVMSDGLKTAPGNYTGALYRVTGPPFSAIAWNSTMIAVSQVGNATFTFSDADNGVFSYSVDGVAGSKPITRQVYAAPPTVCR